MKGRRHDVVARRLFERAHRLAVAGRARAAETLFDRGLARDSRAAYALLYRAGLRLRRGDEAGAEADLDALAALPADVYVRYREFEIPSPDIYPGFEARLDAFVVRTRHPFARLLRAFARRASMRYEGAIADMERASAAAPRNAGLLAVLARVRFVNRLPEQALADLGKAVRLDPRCGWIRAWRAEALRHHGRLREALRDAESAARLDPDYFRSFGWRGGIRRLMGRPAEALKDIDRALSVDRVYWWGVKPGGREADPNLSWLLNERVLALRALGRTGEAVRGLNEAHRLNTRYGWGRPGTADGALFAAGERELSDRLKKRPRDAWARAWRGWTHLESGRPREALADLDGSVRALPREACPALWRARALAELGRSRDALAESGRACRLDPLYAPARAWRGGLLRAAGRLRPALRELETACRLDPVLAWAWAWQGECLLRLNRPAKSLEPLRRATALDVDNADAAAWRAEALAALGRRAEAARAARAALAVRPGHWRALAVLAGLTGRRKLLDQALANAPEDSRVRAEAAR